MSASLANLELIFSQCICKNGTFECIINHSHHILGWNLFSSLTGGEKKWLSFWELRWNCKPFILMLSWRSFHTGMRTAPDHWRMGCSKYQHQDRQTVSTIQRSMMDYPTFAPATWHHVWNMIHNWVYDDPHLIFKLLFPLRKQAIILDSSVKKCRRVIRQIFRKHGQWNTRRTCLKIVHVAWELLCVAARLWLVRGNDLCHSPPNWDLTL